MDATRPTMGLYALTGVSAVTAAVTFKGAFAGRASAKRRQTRAVYGVALAVAVIGAYKLYQQGALSMGDPYGEDGYGGLTGKLRRLTRRLRRLNRRVGRIRGRRGRETWRTRRLQRRIDKIKAKISGLESAAGGQGIPGYSPEIAASLDVSAQVAPPMMDEYPMEPMGSETPEWLIPAAIGGGLLMVVAALAARNRG
jgi:hypothetical protein